MRQGLYSRRMSPSFDRACPSRREFEMENIVRANRELEAKNEQNEQMLSQTRIDLDQLQAKLEVLQERNEALEMQNSSHIKSKTHAFVEQYECKIAQQNHQLDSFTKQNMNLEKQSEGIRKELINEREKISRLEGLLKKSHAAKAQLSKRLDGQLANNEKLIRDMHELKVRRTGMREISPLVEDHIRDLNRECEYYRSENHNLMLAMGTVERGESRTGSGDYDRVITERDQLRSMVGKLEAKMSQINCNIVGLTAESESFPSRASSGRADGRIRELQEKLRNERERGHVVDRENERLRNQLIHVVEKVKKRRFREEVQLRSRSEESGELKQVLAERESEILMLRGRMEDFHAEIESLRKTADMQIKTDLAAKEDELMEVIKQNGEMEDEICRLSKEVSRNEEEIHFLRRDNKSREDWREGGQMEKTLLENIKSYRDEVQRLAGVEEEYSALSEEVRRMRQDRGEWERERRDLIVQVEKCHQSERELRTELSSVAGDGRKYSELVGELEGKLGRMSQSEQSLRDQVGGLEREKIALTGKIKNCEENILTLRLELEKLQTLAADKGKLIAKLEEDLEGRAAEVEELKRQIQIDRDKLEDVGRNLESSRQSRVHQELKIGERQSKIRTMEERIGLMTTRNCDLVRDLRVSRDTCSELESDLRRTRRDLSWQRLQSDRAMSELRRHGLGLQLVSEVQSSF